MVTFATCISHQRHLLLFSLAFDTSVGCCFRFSCVYDSCWRVARKQSAFESNKVMISATFSITLSGFHAFADTKSTKIKNPPKKSTTFHHQNSKNTIPSHLSSSKNSLVSTVFQLSTQLTRLSRGPPSFPPPPPHLSCCKALIVAPKVTMSGMTFAGRKQAWIMYISGQFIINP